jgi:hypothetical protein
MLAALVPGCTIGGTLDTIPGKSAVHVTDVSPGGPVGSPRPECPANLPAWNCPGTSQYECHADTETGCDICSCRIEPVRE